MVSFSFTNLLQLQDLIHLLRVYPALDTEFYSSRKTFVGRMVKKVVPTPVVPTLLHV